MEEISEDAQRQSSRSEDFREADVSTAAAGASEGGRGIEEQGGGERKEEEEKEEATVGGETRSSKPGCKRLLITLSVVFSFLLGRFFSSSLIPEPSLQQFYHIQVGTLEAQ